MLITRTSMLSGNTTERELDITTQQILDYERGALLQDALSNLSADDREFFKSGVTEEEWSSAFGEEEFDDGLDWDNGTPDQILDWD
jgi:hypothetical protein